MQSADQIQRSTHSPSFGNLEGSNETEREDTASCLSSMKTLVQHKPKGSSLRVTKAKNTSEEHLTVKKQCDDNAGSDAISLRECAPTHTWQSFSGALRELLEPQHMPCRRTAHSSRAAPTRCHCCLHCYTEATLKKAVTPSAPHSHSLLQRQQRLNSV